MPIGREVSHFKTVICMYIAFIIGEWPSFTLAILSVINSWFKAHNLVALDKISQCVQYGTFVQYILKIGRV